MKQEEANMLELWGNMLDSWGSYRLDELNYMSLAQGHPLFIRRENLRRQKQRDEADEGTQPIEVAQLPEAHMNDR